MSENCKSLVLQDKCNIEIFLSPVDDTAIPQGSLLKPIFQSYHDGQFKSVLGPFFSHKNCLNGCCHIRPSAGCGGPQ